MKKEEVLQAANDYCNERRYTEVHLTGDFKNKFADFFAKKYADKSIDDENVVNDLKFSLDTAHSASYCGIGAIEKNHATQVDDYKRQIEELTQKLEKQTKDVPPTIPDEVQKQLDELQKFKDAEAKKNKFNDVLKIAKTSVREDLHKSFESFANGIEVSLDKDDKEQADSMVARFQEIFKDSIGDIKPLAPKQTQKNIEDFVASLPKVKVK
jgi:hypothetical protein